MALLVTDDERVSSALAFVEVLRAVERLTAESEREGSSAPSERLGDRLSVRARQVLARIALIVIDRQVLRAAAELAPSDLRTLDAIHLATALSITPAVDGVVTYDARMQAAARSAGLEVLAPGADG